MRVRVHRKNCRRNTGFDIRDENMNKIDWLPELVLINCEMVVDLKKRRDLINAQFKGDGSAHAWIEGEIINQEIPATRNMQEITYHPGEDSAFHYKYTKKPIFQASKLVFNRFGVFILEE